VLTWLREIESGDVGSAILYCYFTLMFISL